ncbi:MAG: hypothetical protein PVG78_00335 [Desulfobacterales bacterium]
MPARTDQDGRRQFLLRRRIMEFLYERFQAFPYAFTELEAIEEACETSSRELNWNLVYLEKSGFLELAKTPDSFPYVAAGAALTARGIDLVEDENEFDRKFPP